MALAQRDAQPRIDLEHFALALLEGSTKRRSECSIIQRHEPLGFSFSNRPDNRAPVPVAIALERQNRQGAAIGEELPGRTLVRCGATHPGDAGPMPLTPIPG